MRNFIQPGNSLSAIAPAGGVVSGTPVIIGSTFGVPGTTAKEGEEFELHLVGVYRLPKATAAAWAFGDKVYWDATAKVVNKTASGNTLIGTAAGLVGELSASTSGEVRLGVQA